MTFTWVSHDFHHHLPQPLPAQMGTPSCALTFFKRGCPMTLVSHDFPRVGQFRCAIVKGQQRTPVGGQLGQALVLLVGERRVQHLLQRLDLARQAAVLAVDEHGYEADIKLLGNHIQIGDARSARNYFSAGCDEGVAGVGDCGCVAACEFDGCSFAMPLKLFVKSA